MAKSEPANLVLMGRIGAAHGIRGEVRLNSFTEDPEAIAAYGELSTNRPGLIITILSARPAKNVLVARLKGVTDRNAAEALNGVELFVPRDRLPPADEDEFYHADLVGLEARREDGSVIGRVAALPNYGAGDLIEIETDSGETLLLPFTRATVPQIDIPAGYLTLVPPAETTAEGETE
jgi:16S rRNA processing protein RimM